MRVSEKTQKHAIAKVEYAYPKSGLRILNRGLACTGSESGSNGIIGHRDTRVPRRIGWKSPEDREEAPEVGGLCVRGRGLFRRFALLGNGAQRSERVRSR